MLLGYTGKIAWINLGDKSIEIQELKEKEFVDPMTILPHWSKNK